MYNMYDATSKTSIINGGTQSDGIINQTMTPAKDNRKRIKMTMFITSGFIFFVFTRFYKWKNFHQLNLMYHPDFVRALFGDDHPQ